MFNCFDNTWVYCISDAPRTRQGVSILVKDRLNEPKFKTIAVENKLFDFNKMKKDSAKSATDSMLRNQLFSTKSAMGLNPTSVPSDTHLFTAPGQFDVPQSRKIDRNRNNRLASNTKPFPPIDSFAMGPSNEITAFQTTGNFAELLPRNNGQTVTPSPLTKFHDQASLLAMVSEQISKRQQPSSATSTITGTTSFTRRPSFSTSRMPFTGPASAWDREPKLPENLDINIPSPTTRTTSAGRVDLPPPPIDTPKLIQNTWSTSKVEFNRPGFTTARPPFTQKTITTQRNIFDPIPDTGLFGLASPLKPVFEASPPKPVFEVSGSGGINNLKATTVIPALSHGFDSGFNNNQDTQNLAPRNDPGFSAQTPTSFLFDPVSSPPQTARDVRVDIGPPPPVNINQVKNVHAIDTAHKIEQIPRKHAPQFSTVTTPGPDLTNTFDQFTMQAPSAFPPLMDTVSVTENTRGTSVSPVRLTNRSNNVQPQTPPVQPEWTNAVNKTKHAESISVSLAPVNTTEAPIIPYDMSPFQHNENWAIFDPTSLPPGVNFSDYGPIIEIPIDTHVQFKSANEVGFQNMFSQAVPSDAAVQTNEVVNNVSSEIISTNGVTEQPQFNYMDAAASQNLQTEKAVSTFITRQPLEGKVSSTSDATGIADAQLVDIYQIGQTKNIDVSPVKETSLSNHGFADIQVDTHTTGSQTPVDIPLPPLPPI